MVMAGKRVFVSGVGGELGTTIAGLLEAESWVGELSGIDADPPRHRLQRTAFHRIHPDEHDRIVETVASFNPHVLVHVGVWEPDRACRAAACRHVDRSGRHLDPRCRCRVLCARTRGRAQRYRDLRTPAGIAHPAERDGTGRSHEQLGANGRGDRAHRRQGRRTRGRHRRSSSSGPGARAARPVTTRPAAPPTGGPVQRPGRSAVRGRSRTTMPPARSSPRLESGSASRSTSSPRERSPPCKPRAADAVFPSRSSVLNGGSHGRSASSSARRSPTMCPKPCTAVASPTTDACSSCSVSLLSTARPT